MKTLIIILCSTFVINLQALAEAVTPNDLVAVCITEFPTTSFIGMADGGKFNVSLINSNGAEYMPIHYGLVTPHDLAIMEKRAKVLKSLGRVSDFSFDLKDCGVYSDGTFSCTNGSTFKAQDGVEFELYSLYSGHSKQMINDNEYEQTVITAFLIVDKESYFVTMTYSPMECSIGHK